MEQNKFKLELHTRRGSLRIGVRTFSSSESQSDDEEDRRSGSDSSELFVAVGSAPIAGPGAWTSSVSISVMTLAVSTSSAGTGPSGSTVVMRDLSTFWKTW